MVKAGLMMWLAHDRCVFEQLGEGICRKTKFTLATGAGEEIYWRELGVHPGGQSSRTGNEPIRLAKRLFPAAGWIKPVG
jgi:hypothetical protein